MTVHAKPVPATPTIDDIRAAAKRIEGLARRTPLLESAVLNRKFGARLLFKPEVLQRTGSFKFRGAYNKIASLTEAERARGVVAFSSGNHAQGVAAAAELFGIPAVIVMPADAPAIKADNVRAMGAEIVPYDRYRDDREAVARPYVEQGMALVKPFDDPLIVAGQGTVGLEIAEEAAAMGVRLDGVVTPCGGGGLMAGIATAVKALSPDTAIWGGEPENFDDTRRSLAAGSRVSADPAASSICDALMSPMPGELTFAINRRLVAGVAAVPEAAIISAMRDAAAHLKLLVEPGGAAGFAALSSGEIELAGKTIAVVLSGGNVDLRTFAVLVGGQVAS
ncbi:MAG TPA: threonine/serine dehydratase [Thermomicrobiales bacterium]|nr:threonine/serine dehydratase [Thermomicrobiales bacterium]